MERLLIILAVLVCVAAGIAALAMAGRGRRPPLRMDHDLDEDDEHLILGSVGSPESPIDRSAQVLDAQGPDLGPIEAAPRIEPPPRGRPEGAR